MTEGSPKRKSFDDETLEAALNPSKNYPRKRVAVACEVCRLRKTKCDAKRPCGFCTDAGIECVYRSSNPAENKLSSAAEVLSRIEERLERVEYALLPPSESTGTPASQRLMSVDALPSRRRGSQSTDDARRYFQHVMSAPQYDFSFRQTAGEAVTARPSILSFTCPPYINFDSWDDSATFYDDEMASEERMFAMGESYRDQFLDTSIRTVWQLQQNFILNFLQWMPLLELDDLVQHVNLAQADHFSLSNPSSSLSMFVFAIGAIAGDRGCLSSGHHNHAEEYPGLQYFFAGRQGIEYLSRSRRRHILTLQCRVLQVCYLQIAIRPLLAWDCVMELARDCMHLLSSNALENANQEYRESFHRVFWICSILFHELEAVLKTHPIGLRQFHEVVPLPLTNSEDEGFYYFLAQASLRKLLTETLDVVGYRVGQIIYAPIIVAELCKQVDEWYEHLPPPICFPVNSSPLFDLRKSFLRVQYVALHTVIFWPSVLQYLQLCTEGNGERGSSKMQNLQKEARSWVQYCILCCECAEELLVQRHLGLQFAIWASYATMCMLLITYENPHLAFIPQTRDHRHIRKVFHVLQSWDEMKIVQRGLKRAMKQIKNASIPIDNV